MSASELSLADGRDRPLRHLDPGMMPLPDTAAGLEWSSLVNAAKAYEGECPPPSHASSYQPLCLTASGGPWGWEGRHSGSRVGGARLTSFPVSLHSPGQTSSPLTLSDRVCGQGRDCACGPQPQSGLHEAGMNMSGPERALARQPLLLPLQGKTGAVQTV